MPNFATIGENFWSYNGMSYARVTNFELQWQKHDEQMKEREKPGPAADSATLPHVTLSFSVLTHEAEAMC
jgi:hypothetical protein